MRISEISLFKIDFPMICGKFSCTDEPEVNQAEGVIVKIETDDGIVGYGETCSIGGYPIYAASIQAGIAELSQRYLLGEDPRNIGPLYRIMERTLKGCNFIKSAVDMACWDILGKALDQPVYLLLGGRQQETIPLYRSVSMASPERMVREVGDLREQGYRHFQLKVGREPSQDIERILAVLSHKESGESYTVDANGRWRVDQALYVLRAVRDTDITVEQPCWTYEECLALRKRIDFPIKFDNSINGVRDVLRAYRENACEAISLKVGRVGGLTQARIIRDIASEVGMAITLDDTWGSEIVMSALAHLAVSTRPDRLLNTTDIHNYSMLDEIASSQVIVEHGELTLAHAPGLGIEVHDDMLGEPSMVFRDCKNKL